MIRPRLSGKLLAAAFAFLLTSCGGNEQTTTETSDSTATADSTAVATPVSTITTAPQGMMIARHKVGDFGKWLASYEAHDSLRLANGIHSYVIGRSVADSNTILVALKVDDVAKAKEFGKSASLKEAMKKGGVVGQPKMMLITAVYQDTATLGPDVLRSLTISTVKDWDAWKKSFESHRQIRIDNGVSDRVYGYDVDDNKKVSLVTALTDTAKAMAFWKSDQLKQLRAESGTVGEPERFVFRIAKRYY
jgi:hypothetical protein